MVLSWQFLRSARPSTSLHYAQGERVGGQQQGLFPFVLSVAAERRSRSMLPVSVPFLTKCHCPQGERGPAAQSAGKIPKRRKVMNPNRVTIGFVMVLW